MPRLTIIGYGNPLRGDDGLGYHVAERLARKVEQEGRGRDIEVLVLQQLTPEVAEAVSGSERVIFIDATCRLPPGRIACEEIVPRFPRHHPTTHHLDPAGVLALARLLDPGCAPQALLLTVGGDSFGYREAFSATAAKSVSAVDRALDQWLEGFLSP
ncbi:MAG: hydrogenase maturation protease [Desulfobacteraceae bacterium]|nr:hydrogenase maturation protease [Desulfobacteraceae bacterium]